MPSRQSQEYGSQQEVSCCIDRYLRCLALSCCTSDARKSRHHSSPTPKPRPREQGEPSYIISVQCSKSLAPAVRRMGPGRSQASRTTAGGRALAAGADTKLGQLEVWAVASRVTDAESQVTCMVMYFWLQFQLPLNLQVDCRAESGFARLRSSARSSPSACRLCRTAAFDHFRQLWTRLSRPGRSGLRLGRQINSAGKPRYSDIQIHDIEIYLYIETDS